jgi:hypothetical protein
MRRISVISSARCDGVFPDQAPAILTVVTAIGEHLVEEVLVNRGGPERPLSAAEVAAKFLFTSIFAQDISKDECEEHDASTEQRKSPAMSFHEIAE